MFRFISTLLLTVPENASTVVFAAPPSFLPASRTWREARKLGIAAVAAEWNLPFGSGRFDPTVMSGV